MNAHGIVHKYGDHVDTDVIIPARYLATQDPKELAASCMIDIDTEFVKKVKEGDIMVAGANFGCGSSRNSINIGLAILECPAASEGIDTGDEVEVDFDTGIITNVTKNETYQAEPFPPFIKDMIAKGGLMASLKAKEA